MKFLKLMGYVVKDSIEYWKNGKYQRLFGVSMYVGDVGQGKTLSMTYDVLKLKEKDPRIKVYTNFFMEGEDGRIEHWKDMMDVPSYSIICLDEVSNTFNQRNWSNFPSEMIQLLTQNRKFGNDENGTRPPGIKLLMTTQDYDNTDVFIRRLCNTVIQCSSYFKGRLIFNRSYKRKEYEKTDEKRRNSGRHSFVATDGLRNSYNTYRLLSSMRTKDEEEQLKGGKKLKAK